MNEGEASLKPQYPRRALQYARQAIQVRLKDDENRAEEQKMAEKEIKDRLKD